MEGTSLIRFKTAYIALLNTALTNASLTYAVAYQSPMQAEDMLGQGTGVAAWFDDLGTASHDVDVFKGAPHWFDEVVLPVLRIQSMGLDTDDGQAAVDARANTVLGYAIAVLANDPSVGLVDDTIQEFTALPHAWTYAGGVLGTNQRGARFDLTISVEARLKLVIP